MALSEPALAAFAEAFFHEVAREHPEWARARNGSDPPPKPN